MKLKCIMHVLLLFSLTACASDASDRTLKHVPGSVIKALQKHNIEITRYLKKHEDTIAFDLNELPWALDQAVCKDAGYDLSPFKGRKAVLYCFKTDYKWNASASYKEPLNVWVITVENQCVGLYFSVTERSNAAPGLFSIKIPVIYKSH